MIDGKRKESAGGGLPGGTLWRMKWAVIVALVVLFLLFIVPRGASAWNGRSATDGQHKIRFLRHGVHDHLAARKASDHYPVCISDA